ncbi:ABC transporter substrate-binding protein, partial [Chloroflexota bacterium]
VVFSLNQVITIPTAYLYKTNAALRDTKITSPSPWTVEVKVPWLAMQVAIMRFGEYIHIVPPEVVEKYGDMADPQNSVGTGPFILQDHVDGSQTTVVRNPNYWMKDPVGPGEGNQLPYLDAVRMLIIPDASTRQAALRTGKIDVHGSIIYEDYNLFRNTSPELLWRKSYPQTLMHMGMRIDREPFTDIRVRRALMMATDFESIKRDYYADDAQIVTFPIVYVRGYEAAYLGPDPETGEWPEDTPESVKELYVYNPEKAKQLLAEAGYPDGFKTHMNMQNAQAIVDYYSIIKGMWSKVGVNLELRPMETGPLTKMSWDHTQEQILYAIGGGPPIATGLWQLGNMRGTGQNNIAMINDPLVEEAFTKIQTLAIIDQPEAMAVHRELMKYVLDQAWAIPQHGPARYKAWWPWLRNYSGEDAVGYFNAYYRWVWIDQELKESMGY